MLVVKNVTKMFGEDNSVNVIKGIDLTINEGEFVMITGKSGSGKTTLLYLMSGLEKVSTGEIQYKNRSIVDISDKEMSEIRRREFGFVFQFYNLIPTLKVIDNINLPIELDHRITGGEKKQIEKYAEMLEIDHLLNRYPYQLSGGQQQRVSIVRALAINPTIIFADEPTGNLDQHSGECVLEILKKINLEMKKTIVMVTHDQSITNQYASRVIEVRDGRII